MSFRRKTIKLIKWIFKLIILLIILIQIKHLQKSYGFSNNNSNSELDSFSEKNFSHLLPRITLKKDNNDNDNDDDDSNLDEIIPSIKDIFYSREIYINDNNLTNE